MSIVGRLIGFAVRQVAGEAVGALVKAIETHFADHSRLLPNALAKANDRAWQALAIALAGDGFLDRIKLLFVSADERGVREQVRHFLKDKQVLCDASTDFRTKCLAEFKHARDAGLLSADTLSPGEIGEHAASFQHYSGLKDLLEGAEKVVAQMADGLRGEFPNLAKLVQQRFVDGPPLLVSAFTFFFRREVETNQELAHGLIFDGLRQLSVSQDNSFASINKALTTFQSHFVDVFEQLDRIDVAIGKIQAAALGTHETVLDVHVRLQQLDASSEAHAGELRGLLRKVLDRFNQTAGPAQDRAAGHLLRRGEAHENSGEYSQAIADYSEAIGICPNLAEYDFTASSRCTSRLPVDFLTAAL